MNHIALIAALLLMAGLAQASPAELWEIEDAGERAVPSVDLSMNKPPM